MTQRPDTQGWIAITGASSGIGKATALFFAAHGYSVALIARRTHLLEALEREIREHAHQNNLSLEVMCVTADLSCEEGIDHAIETLSPLKLSLLIHNAAMIHPITSLMELSRSEWKRHQTLNVDAPLFITQGLVTQLEGGRVIHISSGAAHKSVSGWGAYCISKAALYRMWACLKDELATKDIAIASVRPGVVDTEMQSEIRSADHPAFTQRPYFEGLKAQGQLIKPGQVAAFLYHLFHDVPSDEFSAHEWDIRD